MSDFLSKIKDKLFPKPDLDFDDDFSDDSEAIDNIEVESGDPDAISDAKKKNYIIVIVALVLSIFVYYIFFTEGEVVKEDLVRTRDFTGGVVRTEKSPFQIDIEEQKEDVAVLAKPSVPELPDMPELEEEGLDKKDSIFDDSLFEEEEEEVAQDSEEEVELTTAKNELRVVDKFKGKDIKVLEPPKEGLKKSDADFSDPKYAPIILVRGSPGQKIPGVGRDNNIKILDEGFIVDVADSVESIKPSRIKNRENVIGQGKIINAVLETAIDTELAGSVRAVVSRDVYGEVGNRILISKGSRLYGEYSTGNSKGNARVNITWTRLIRPDGITVSINSSASDQFGRAGIEGSIDNKFGETISNTFLSSVLAIAGVAATDALTGGTSSTTTVDPSTGTSTVTQNAINQAVVGIAKNITDSAQEAVSGLFDTSPRITIPQGTRVTVIVNSDIKIPTFEK